MFSIEFLKLQRGLSGKHLASHGPIARECQSSADFREVMIGGGRARVSTPFDGRGEVGFCNINGCTHLSSCYGCSGMSCSKHL